MLNSETLRNASSAELAQLIQLTLCKDLPADWAKPLPLEETAHLGVNLLIMLADIYHRLAELEERFEDHSDDE